MASPSASLVDLARAAALRGGSLIREATKRPAFEQKAVGDYVTEVDRLSERVIEEVLSAGEPDIPMIGEEGGGTTSARYWLVDPLDGTTNFVHGFPIVGVSIALVEDGRPVLGVIHAPFLGETYIAALGQGATLERQDGSGERLAVSQRPVERAVVGTGFPFRNKERFARYLRVMQLALGSFEDLRRPGAASLDLAWVAAGVFDGFFELGLGPWDVAAGAVVIQEAGGTVTDWTGGPDVLSGDILAGPPAVHAELLRLISEA
ncbi:MAG: inositol monophosphatase family protein [Actinomycetota bacterium]